jgi:DNA-binding NarL/FixJ family response regulator
MTESTAASPSDGDPVRVAIVNDYELIVLGVAAMLAPFEKRVRVVELDSGLPVVADVDVVLYDTFGQVQGDGVDLEDLVAGGESKVAIYSWNLQPELVQRSLDRGAAAYLSKGLSSAELVSAIEQVRDGRRIVPEKTRTTERAEGNWPGKEFGLSSREAEIIALITQGLSNQEIAERSYLSINSVKTYIRTAYRKMGVGSRSQAVLWGVNHGFQPDVARAMTEPPPS